MHHRLFLTTLLLLTGCATHRVVVPLPVTGSENASPAETSNALFWGQKTKPVQAQRCAGSNALSEVRAETSFAAALATVLTLGFWQPLKVQYLCAKPPTDVETIERPQER
jgi:Bor protein